MLRGPRLRSRPSQDDWRSLNDVLEIGAARDPARGIYLVDAAGSQTFRTFEQMRDDALRVASALHRRGVKRHHRVLLTLPTGFDFLATFFGCLRLGAAPVPLPPETMRPEFLADLGAAIGAEAVVHQPAREAPLQQLRQRLGSPFRLSTDVPSLLSEGALEADLPELLEQPELAYIQPTSGTTGRPRAVMLSHANILHSLRAVGEALDVDPGRDFGASWLPLHSVMGLIGFVIFSLYHGMDLALLDPRRFLSRPEEWLWLIARHRATVSAAPDFAYSYALRRCNASDLEGLDLSSWRVAMSATEPVRLEHLRAFHKRFAPYGLRPEALTPVYGMTEATLGISFADPEAIACADPIERWSLEHQGLPHRLDEAQEPGQRLHVVSVGRPLAEMEVAIVDGQGRELPERHLGEIALRGPTVTSGYAEMVNGASQGAPMPRTRLDGQGRLLTGDMGYVAEGDLYIVGRMINRLAVSASRKIFAEEVDHVVSKVDGVRSGGAVAFLSGSDLVVGYETQAGVGAGEVEADIRRALALRLHIEEVKLVCLSPKSVPKTSHGKVQRQLALQLYDEGRLDAQQRFDDLDGLRKVWMRTRSDLQRVGQEVLDRVGRIIERHDED